MTLADILRGGLYVLDTPGALTRGAVANLADIVRGQDRFQGYRATGREMLESMGMERNRPGLDVGDVAGVGADILVDPVNWAGGWAAKAALNALRAKKAMQAGEVAAQAARPGLGEIISQSGALVPRQPSGLEGVLKMMPQQPMPMTGLPAKPPAPLGLPAPIPPFYSRLEEAARGLPGRQYKAQSLPNMLKKSPGGVSDEEMEWVLKGLPQQGVVSREDLMRHIDQNRLRVDERVYDVPPATQQDFDNWLRSVGVTPEQWNSYGPQQRFSLETTFGRGLDKGNYTRWNEHATPGGTNYKEMLLKLPERKLTPMEQREIDAIVAEKDKWWRQLNQGGQISAYEYEQRVAPIEAKLRALKSTSFDSEHWADDPNTFAHVRFDERVGPQGEKNLFVHEIQSDWNQKGSVAGYSPDENAMLLAKHTTDRDKIGKQINEYSQKHGIERLQDAYGKAERRVGKAMEGPVPDNPFKGDKWVELTVKRLLKHATDNGFDRITWNNGELAAKHSAGGATGEIAEGLAHWYDTVLPKVFKKIIKGGKYEQIPMEVDGVPQLVHSITVPQAIKKQVSSRGQALMSLLPLGAAAPWAMNELSGQENDPLGQILRGTNG